MDSFAGIALALYDCTVTENGGAPSSINFTDVPAGLFPQEQQVCGNGPWYVMIVFCPLLR